MTIPTFYNTFTTLWDRINYAKEPSIPEFDVPRVRTPISRKKWHSRDAINVTVGTLAHRIKKAAPSILLPPPFSSFCGRDCPYRSISITEESGGMAPSGSLPIHEVSVTMVFKLITTPIHLSFSLAKRRKEKIHCGLERIVVRQMGCFIYHYGFLFEHRLRLRERLVPLLKGKLPLCCCWIEVKWFVGLWYWVFGDISSGI